MMLPNSGNPTPPPLLPQGVPPNMMACPDCKRVISRQANSCPNCGRAINASTGNLVWRVMFILIVVGGVAMIISRLSDLL